MHNENKEQDQIRPHFYQTRSAWSVDQGSNKNHSPAYNFAPTVTKFCVMWEGLSLPHDTKFGNCRCKIVDSRSFPSWSLIHGLRWSGLIKVGQGFSNFGISENALACEKLVHNPISLPMVWQKKKKKKKNRGSLANSKQSKKNIDHSTFEIDQWVLTYFQVFRYVRAISPCVILVLKYKWSSYIICK